MDRTGMLILWTACLAAFPACTGGGLFSHLPTASSAATRTDNPIPTATSTQTVPPFPARTSSPTRIPGIEEPLPAGDAQLLITKALLRDVFRCGTESEPVENPGENIFLILLAAVEDGPKATSTQLDKWIRDNGIDEWVIHCSGPAQAGASIGPLRWCTTRDRETLTLTQLDMAFPVAVDAATFSPILPEGLEIPLTPIMP
ncbi:MAG: hypothetical protein JW748_11595 [Anaerolineales bacterium]|nr:hypothetical protein [Anaerolineales bacterium]